MKLFCSHVNYFLTELYIKCLEILIFNNYPLPQTMISLTLMSSSSNSTIVPLFEKMLSASDAGRIGRLVLPKACAEVSFLFFLCFCLLNSTFH